ncbi:MULTISPECIES: hypothetical protein [Luteimonas]|uniref:hypothetical protein n=1 Tax=Luteimonas TaxID=83614 RepID=UPI000C7E1D00|nr:MULTISPECIES: hypothetical protein [Luteimonas]
MLRTLFCAVTLCLLPWLASCTAETSVPSTSARPAPAPAVALPSGEHLVYIAGCVNCHHQTPKTIIDAPPLVIAKTYSLPEFATLMRSGVTRDGRDMYAQGSLMGAVARLQFSHLTDAEIAAIHGFLRDDWTAARAAAEEAKLASLPPPTGHHE